MTTNKLMVKNPPIEGEVASRTTEVADEEEDEVEDRIMQLVSPSGP